LPPVPEVFGVRLPPPKDRLTSVDFDLLPNKPPPGVKVYDEEIVEETDEEELPIDGLDEDDEDDEMEELDVTSAANPARDGEEDVDLLFEGEDDDDPDNVNMLGTSAVRQPPQDGGMKRMLVEDDDYD
jgi:transcription initiation factor TFIID subunit 9B